MKKILLITISILLFTAVNSQITIFQETFGNGMSTSSAPGFTFIANDWTVDPGSSPPFVCTVAGSSASGMLIGQDAAMPVGSFEEVGTIAINTSAYTNLQLSWNYLRASMASGPSVTCEISNTGAAGQWTTVAYAPGSPGDGVWGAVAPVTLPANAVSTTLFIRWSYFTTGSMGSNYVTIDDVLLTGTGTPIFYWDGVGALDNVASWWLNPNATGGHPTDFITPGQTFNMINAPSGALTAAWTVSGANTMLNIGDGTVPNQCQLTIPAAFALTLGAGAKITVTNSSTLTMQNTSFPAIGSVSLGATSTIEFGQASAVTIWQTNNYGNLFLSGGGAKTQPGNIQVNGEFNIAAGTTYVMIANAIRTTRLSGVITCNGNITPNFSNLTIDGANTNAIGTINFNGANSINGLSVNRTGQTLTLAGNNLTVRGVAAITNGNINLNGTTLTFSNTTTLPSAGLFTGSGTSALTFTGAGSITNSLNMDQTSSSTETLKALVTNKSLTLGNAMQITDSVKVSGGTLSTSGALTLISTSALKGRIADCTGGSVTGNITVQTFALGGTTDWANLGASGVSGLQLSAWDNPATFPMTCNGCNNATTSVAGGFASAVSYNEGGVGNAAYVTMNSTDALTPGQGFWMYLGLSANTTADMLWTVSGSPVSGGVTGPAMTISNNSGYNLLANPYPCPISWAKVLASNPGLVNNATYIYNADVGPTAYVNGVSDHPGQGANDVIPMGQGFCVQAISAGALTFAESHKVSNNTSTDQLLRSSSMSASNPTVGSVIRLNIVGGGYSDATAIRFHPSATPFFDQTLDAHKLYGSPGYQGYPGEWTKRTAIATQINSEDYAINSLPYAQTQNLVLPVIARVYGSGQYTISGSDLQNLPANTCIILKDKLTNTTQDLRTGNYVFMISDTTFAPRFELTVCANSSITNIKTQSAISNNNIYISKDAAGVFVDFDFDKITNANIIVTNVLGQKIMDTKKVRTTQDKFYLNLNTNDQLIFVTVETENEKITKKFLNYN